jgi:Zn-dependent M28 family amino/carboxypeptidase
MWRLVRSRHVCLILLLLFLALSASAERIYYDPVSRDVAVSRLNQYKGNDRQREGTLKKLFVEAGCSESQISEQSVTRSKLPNLVCTLPGQTNNVIIVGAHYDHDDRGNGVVDNWSGASLLPSLYEAIKRVPLKHTFVFIGFTDEEKGEVGSRYYAQAMTDQQVADTSAMVNMDVIGLAPTEVWATRSDRHLVDVLLNVAGQMKVPVSKMNVEDVGSTDSVQFADRKIPSITIHSVTQVAWNTHILHSNRDVLSALNLDDYYETYKLVSAYLAFLDKVLVPGASSAN